MGETTQVKRQTRSIKSLDIRPQETKPVPKISDLNIRPPDTRLPGTNIPTSLLTPLKSVPQALAIGITRHVPKMLSNILRFGGDIPEPPIVTEVNRIRIKRDNPKATFGGVLAIQKQEKERDRDNLHRMASDIDSYIDRATEFLGDVPEEHKVQNFIDLLNPAKLANTIGEYGPQTVALMIPTVLSPPLGMMLIGAVEGGELSRTIRDYEQRTGTTVDETTRTGSVLGIAVVNAMLERLGFNFMLRRLPGLSKTWKQKLVQTMLTPGVEGTTEYLQDLNKMLVGSGITGIELTQEDYDSLKQSFLVGFAVGQGSTVFSARDIVNTRRIEKAADQIVEQITKEEIETVPQASEKEADNVSSFLEQEKDVTVDAKKYIESAAMIMNKNKLRQHFDYTEEELAKVTDNAEVMKLFDNKKRSKVEIARRDKNFQATEETAERIRKLSPTDVNMKPKSDIVYEAMPRVPEVEEPVVVPDEEVAPELPEREEPEVGEAEELPSQVDRLPIEEMISETRQIMRTGTNPTLISRNVSELITLVRNPNFKQLFPDHKDRTRIRQDVANLQQESVEQLEVGREVVSDRLQARRELALTIEQQQQQDEARDRYKRQQEAASFLIKDNPELAKELLARLQKKFPHVTAGIFDEMFTPSGARLAGWANLKDQIVGWTPTSPVDTIPHEVFELVAPLLIDDSVFQRGVELLPLTRQQILDNVNPIENVIQRVGDYYVGKIQDKGIRDKVERFLREFWARVKAIFGVEKLNADDVIALLGADFFSDTVAAGLTSGPVSDNPNAVAAKRFETLPASIRDRLVKVKLKSLEVLGGMPKYKGGVIFLDEEFFRVLKKRGIKDIEVELYKSIARVDDGYKYGYTEDNLRQAVLESVIDIKMKRVLQPSLSRVTVLGGENYVEFSFEVGQYTQMAEGYAHTEDSIIVRVRSDTAMGTDIMRVLERIGDIPEQLMELIDEFITSSMIQKAAEGGSSKVRFAAGSEYLTRSRKGNLKEITDEHNNTWFETNIVPETDIEPFYRFKRWVDPQQVVDELGGDVSLTRREKRRDLTGLISNIFDNEFNFERLTQKMRKEGDLKGTELAEKALTHTGETIEAGQRAAYATHLDYIWFDGLKSTYKGNQENSRQSVELVRAEQRLGRLLRQKEEGKDVDGEIAETRKTIKSLPEIDDLTRGISIQIAAYFDKMKIKYKDHMRNMLAERISPAVAKAFQEVRETGDYEIELNEDEYVELKTALEQAEGIDKWGLEDYITNIEKGVYKLVRTDKGVPDIRTVAISETESGLVEKAKIYLSGLESTKGVQLEMTTDRISDPKNPNKLEDVSATMTSSQYRATLGRLSNLLDTDFKKVSEALKGIVGIKNKLGFAGPTIRRQDILKGESNIFDVLYSYSRVMHKKMQLDPVILRGRKLEVELDRADMSESAKAVREQMENLKGKYHWSDSALDTLIERINDYVYKRFGRAIGGRPMRSTRIIQKVRTIQANIKLGYRPVNGFINLYSAFAHIASRTGFRIMGKARTFLESDAGKRFTKEEEQYQGMSFSMEAVGEKMRSAIPIYYPVGVFQLPEPVIRRYALAANYLKFKEDNPDASEATARTFARRALRAQALTYDVASLPKMLRSPGGKIFGQFKAYLVKELQFLRLSTPREFASYMAMYMLLGGPRALIYMMRSIPIFGMLLDWKFIDPGDEDESVEGKGRVIGDMSIPEWLDITAPGFVNKQLGLSEESRVGNIAVRGFGGIVGTDFTAAAAFQFPQTLPELGGPLVADIAQLVRQVGVPIAQQTMYEFGAKEVGDLAMSMAPFLRYWDMAIDAYISGDGWIRDRNGNPTFRVEGWWNLPMLLAGTRPEEDVRRSAMHRKITEDGRRRRIIQGKVVRTLLDHVFGEGLVKTIQAGLYDKFPEIIPAVNTSIPQWLIDDIAAFGITAEIIEQTELWRNTPQLLQDLLKAPLREKGIIWDLIR